MKLRKQTPLAIVPVNLAGTTECSAQIKAKVFPGALLLIFGRVSQNKRKVLRSGFEGVSVALLDANGFGSDLIQRGDRYLERVSSSAVITLSIYIIT